MIICPAVATCSTHAIYINGNLFHKTKVRRVWAEFGPTRCYALMRVFFVVAADPVAVTAVLDDSATSGKLRYSCSSWRCLGLIYLIDL